MKKTVSRSLEAVDRESIFLINIILALIQSNKVINIANEFM